MNKKLFLSIPALVPLLVGCVGTKHYETIRYFDEVKWSNPGEDFRILQLCDIHLSQSDIYERHFAIIDETIERSHANMIVINGDSFTYADKKVVNLLFKFIDGHKIPWTFTYGNHDDQGYFADTYIQRLLASDEFSYCKFINLEDDDVTGRSNFCVNIKKEGKVAFQVYCLESHSYNFDTMEYDFIKKDQIDWYKRMVNYSTEKFGGGSVIPSAMYFHIPTPEFFTAWNEAKSGNGGEVILGSTDEFGGGPLPSSDTHIVDVIKELGSTKAISCAHDHINDSVIKCDDLYFCFGVHSTDRIYYDDAKLGGQVIIVNHDNPSNLSFENIKLTYSEVEGK